MLSWDFMFTAGKLLNQGFLSVTDISVHFQTQFRRLPHLSGVDLPKAVNSDTNIISIPLLNSDKREIYRRGRSFECCDPELSKTCRPKTLLSVSAWK